MDGRLCALEVSGEKELIASRFSLATNDFYIPEEVGEAEAVFGCCGAYLEAHFA